MRFRVLIPLAMLLLGSLQACRDSCSAPSSLEPGHDLPSLGCGDYSAGLPGSVSDPDLSGPDQSATGGADPNWGGADSGGLGGEGGAE